MTASDILAVVSITLLLAGILGAVIGIGWKLRRDRLAERVNMEKLYRESLARLSEAMEKNGDGLSAVPKLYEGMIRLAEEQVAQVTKLRESVDLLSSCLLNTRDGRSRDEYSGRVAEAEAEYEAQQLMRDGVPEQEARERAREQRVYGRMFER